MVNQAKIDLAVLLKLFQHAEENGGAETPQVISSFFEIAIAVPRIVAALEKLAGRSEVVRIQDRYYEDEGLWRISGDGIRTVEKALKQPSSFIARLQTNGDLWLSSEEAEAATLTKLKRYHAQDPALLFYNDLDVVPTTAANKPINIINNFQPNNAVRIAFDKGSADRSGWWNFGAAVVFGIAAIIVTLWVSGKL